MRVRGVILGWGLVDVEYSTQKFEVINNKRVCKWTCPYYEAWRGILKRSLSAKEKARYPTYLECTVSEEWKCLSKFIKWVDNQPNKDWTNCVPDKDLLSKTNKHYSPETVVFISPKVNAFLLENNKNRGDYMIGVNWKKQLNKFQARCNNPFTTKSHYIGVFLTEMEAHLAWKAKKHEYACQLADLQSDPRVADALRTRYL